MKSNSAIIYYKLLTGLTMIFDEIPTGLGKTGRMFLSDYDNVVPDILVLGKALGRGILEIATVLSNRNWTLPQIMRLATTLIKNSCHLTGCADDHRYHRRLKLD